MQDLLVVTRSYQKLMNLSQPDILFHCQLECSIDYFEPERLIGIFLKSVTEVRKQFIVEFLIKTCQYTNFVAVVILLHERVSACVGKAYVIQLERKFDLLVLEFVT